MAEKRVYLGIPANWKNIPTVFVQSLVDMEKPAGTVVRFAGGHSISEMRNAIATQAMAGGFTHVFMLDVDMVYPSDSLTRLMGYDKSVIGGFSCQRIPPYTMLYMDKHKPDDEFFILGSANPPPNAVVEVAALGGAGLLIDTDVFRTMEYPYFIGHGKDKEGNGVGEDIWFSAMARKVGWRLWLDTGLRYEHLSDVAVSAEWNEEEGVWDRKVRPVR